MATGDTEKRLERRVKMARTAFGLALAVDPDKKLSGTRDLEYQKREAERALKEWREMAD